VAKKAAVHGIPPSGGFQKPETAKFATAQQKDAERQSPAILYGDFLREALAFGSSSNCALWHLLG